MFNKYLITNDNNKQVLFLYVEDNFEFSSDIESKNKRKNNIYVKINDFIKNNNIKYKGDRVNFIKNGIILGHVNLSDYDIYNNKYVELLDNNVNNKMIDINRSYSILSDLKLEEYIIGVVSAEMPAIFNEEALKALAVITRTYAFKRLSRNLPLDNLNSTQIYRDKYYLKEIWKEHFDEYRNKILKAVRDTKNEVIMYDGDYIDAYYHLLSNDKTEDASNVLMKSYPYLVSVDSNINENDKMIDYKVVPNNYLSKLLNMNINEDTKVNIVLRTAGNRIKYIKFGDKIFDGLTLSKRLGLNSNDFDVNISKDNTTFTSFGYGHGLGLSKYGANDMALKGYDYRDILIHYYPNTYIENVFSN